MLSAAAVSGSRTLGGGGGDTVVYWGHARCFVTQLKDVYILYCSNDPYIPTCPADLAADTYVC